MREEPENRLLLYTVMFVRTFGIFCCFCLISYHIPGSSWYTCHFTSATSTGVCNTGTSALVVCVKFAAAFLLLLLLLLPLHCWLVLKKLKNVICEYNRLNG